MHRNEGMNLRRYYLIALREERNLTQNQAAALIGISEVFLRKIEAGTSNPGRETSLKFEAFYQKSERALFPDLYTDTNCIKIDLGAQ